MAAALITSAQGAITFTVDGNDNINGTVNSVTYQGVPIEQYTLNQNGGPMTVTVPLPDKNFINVCNFSLNYNFGSPNPNKPVWDYLVVSNQTSVDECWIIHIECTAGPGNSCTVSGYVEYVNGNFDIYGSKIVTSLYNGATVYCLPNPNEFSIPYGFSANGLSGAIAVTP
jgi:hypothetical protein